MPYISAEEVKIKREQIKREFPNFRFSITKQDSSEIRVVIREAPFNMIIKDVINGNDQVNSFYIKEHYANHPEIMNVLLKIKEIISSDQEEEVYDGDYGSVPTFYISINVGAYDRPFKVVKKTIKIRKKLTKKAKKI